MALTQFTIGEVQTGGTDTNAGIFDNSQTLTSDLSATSGNTSAPVVSSASYNFVASDVGHWLFVQSGTNWNPGWYKIASVSSNAATLNADIGTAITLLNTNFVGPINTVAGVATTSTPSSGVWTIDYSQQGSKNTTGSNISATDGVCTSGVATLTSATANFQPSMKGNAVYIQGGTPSPITAGWYMCTGVTSTTSITLDRSTGLLTATSVTFNIGGSFNSPGGSMAALTGASSDIYIKSGTYSITSTTSNVSGGRVAIGGGFSIAKASIIEGYGSLRGDKGTRPVLQASAISTFSIISTGSNFVIFDNINIDCNSQTASTGLTITGSRSTFRRLKISNSTANGISITGGAPVIFSCEVTGFSGTAGINIASTSLVSDCYAHGGTTTGFIVNIANSVALIRCISANNTGATSNGFNCTASSGTVSYNGCIAYGNGLHGFTDIGTGVLVTTYLNCIAEGNGVSASGWGFNYGVANSQTQTTQNNATYNNTAGGINNNFQLMNNIAGSTSFFTNAASADFTLNNTAGGGASIRTKAFPINQYPGLTSLTSYNDIGIFQHQDTGGFTGFAILP